MPLRLLPWLLLAPAALAQTGAPRIPPSERPGLGADDPRRPVETDALPWRALGRVQTELGSRCTGTLIAPRRVLTAAHCLVAPNSGQLVQPGSVHVLLGYHLGQWRARARVTGFQLPASFQPRTRGPATADWAVLQLDRPLPGPVLPLLPPPAPGTPLMLGGYQQDRPELLLAATACRLLGHGRATGEGVLPLWHDCAATRGASGGPLLAPLPLGQGNGNGAGWGVAGVAIGARSGQAQGLALGFPRGLPGAPPP